MAFPAITAGLKTIGITLGLVKMGQEIYEWFEDLAPKTKPVEVPTATSCRKKYDTTQFTQEHFDHVLEAYKVHVIKNTGGKKQTQDELTHQLNGELSLNKGKTSYSRIWRGKVNREDLPSSIIPTSEA